MARKCIRRNELNEVHLRTKVAKPTDHKKFDPIDHEISQLNGRKDEEKYYGFQNKGGKVVVLKY